MAGSSDRPVGTPCEIEIVEIRDLGRRAAGDRHVPDVALPRIGEIECREVDQASLVIDRDVADDAVARVAGNWVSSVSLVTVGFAAV